MSLAVKDASGATQAVETLPAKGQAAAAASLPVVEASDSPLIPLLTSIKAAALAPTLAPGGATDASLQQIVTALANERVETLFTDDTGAFFVRIDKGGTISWADVSGNASAAPGTGARPAAGASSQLTKNSFQATAGSTGYSTGDYLDHLLTVDAGNGAVIGNFWVNLSTGAKLASAPASANITPVSPLPPLAATSALQTTGNTFLASIVAALAALLKVDTVVASAAADRSGSITTGGQAQPFAAANASRRGFSIQNQSSGGLWINGQGVAAIAGQPSLYIPAGAYYETPPGHTGTGAISVYGATTGQTFYGREW